jgi:hypothetical protein
MTVHDFNMASLKWNGELRELTCSFYCDVNRAPLTRSYILR